MKIKIPNFFTLYGANRSGGMALPVAIILPTLLGFAGVAYDYSHAQQERTLMQSALDTAVLTAAIHPHGSQHGRNSMAQKAYENNAQNPCNNRIHFSYTADTVSATSTCQLGTSFLGMFGVDSIKIKTKSQAYFWTNQTPGCLRTMDSSDRHSMTLTSSAQIIAPDCAVAVDSSDTSALRISSSATIGAAEICVTGGWNLASSSSTNPTPIVCPVEPDPLASLAIPAEATDPCTATSLSIGSDTVLSPGVYCEGLAVSGADVSLLPGIYVFRDGALTMNSSASVTGADVTLFFTGDDRARMAMSSGTVLDIKAPTTGPYAGMAMFQDPASARSTYLMNGDSSTIVEGVIYLPNADMDMNGGSGMLSNSAWTVLMTRTLQLRGSTELVLNTNYAATDVPVPTNFDFGRLHAFARLTH